MSNCILDIVDIPNLRSTFLQSRQNTVSKFGGFAMLKTLTLWKELLIQVKLAMFGKKIKERELRKSLHYSKIVEGILQWVIILLLCQLLSTYCHGNWLSQVNWGKISLIFLNKWLLINWDLNTLLFLVFTNATLHFARMYRKKTKL